MRILRFMGRAACAPVAVGIVVAEVLFWFLLLICRTLPIWSLTGEWTWPHDERIWR